MYDRSNSNFLRKRHSKKKKKAVATDDLIGNKTTYRITKFSKNSQ